MQAEANISTPTRGATKVAHIFRSYHLWVVLLAAQFIVIQLALNVQYGDGPRNLHWGMMAAENPRFLIGAVDPYDMVNGWTPTPPSLAPAAFTRDAFRGFNNWWGPAPVVLLGLVWGATHSWVLMALALPLSAGLAVLVTYRLGAQLFDERTGFFAAVFVALFPLFYEFGVISYSEGLSTLLLVATFWAYLRERTLAAVLLGACALLCKLNMTPVFCGTIGCCFLFRLRFRRDFRALLHTAAVLLLPLVPLIIWWWTLTGSLVPSTGVPMSLATFWLLLPEMIQMLFYIPWPGALLTIALIVMCGVYGARSPRLDHEARIVLVAWVVFGWLALAVYMTTSIASNSPRVVLPSLPGLALLVAEGLARFSANWRRRSIFYLVALFIAINSVITYNFVEQARYVQTFANVWPVLRQQPRGFVLTSMYWLTMWQTQQPATWFEWDETFQRNVLHNRDNFVRYTSTHPIRYVLVPRAGTNAARDEPLIQLATSNLYGADVKRYLEQNARHIPIPPYYDLYELPASQ